MVMTNHKCNGFPTTSHILAVVAIKFFKTLTESARPAIKVTYSNLKPFSKDVDVEEFTFVKG